jgi:hypothetical protein
MNKKFFVSIILLIIILIVIAAYFIFFKKQSDQQNNPIFNTSLPTSKVKIFFIALNDNGTSGKQIGCGDSVIGVEKEIPKTTTPLQKVLENLFSIKSQTIEPQGFYNSLYQSNLQVESLSINNGQAVVKLKGSYQLGGVCDNPRFKAQIEETILQFPTIKKADIFINNISLDKIVSEKGE